VPLAFVVLSLIVLATVPVLVSTRVRRLRRDITEVSDPAQVLVNDEQAALATQMFALGEIAQGDRTDGLARYGRALAAERRDEAGLDSLARALGADVVAHFAELRTEAVHWHEQIAPLVATGSAGVAAVPPASLRQASHAGAALVLGAAERLEAVIEAFESDRLELHLQPIVSLPQRKIRMYEVLSRLRLADGTPLQGPADLRAAILSRSEMFVTTAAEKLLIYALGRPVHYYDMPAVRSIIRRAAADGYRFSSIVLGIVESDAFQKRVKRT
jgi:hypothetical protein